MGVFCFKKKSLEPFTEHCTVAALVVPLRSLCVPSVPKKFLRLYGTCPVLSYTQSMAYLRYNLVE